MNKARITVSNTASDSSAISDFLIRYISKNDIPDDILNDLRLVAEETFINISCYAFSSNETQSVNIEIEHTADKLNITFIDTGKPFNPLSDNNKNMDTDNYCEGGMGIHLIKSLSDEQRYKRVDEHNVFTVTKHYTK